MARKNKQLEKLLNEQECLSEGRSINEELFEKLKTELVKYKGKEYANYDPIVEIAKLASELTISDELKLRCHSIIAEYMYPKVKSFEIRSKEDKEINININIAPYAQTYDAEIIPEEVELVEELNKKRLQ